MLKRLLIFLLLSVSLRAQEVTRPPKFDKDDMVILQAIVALSQQSNAACNDLPQTKNFNEVYNKIKIRMEEKYVGYTLEGINLVAKKDTK